MKFKRILCTGIAILSMLAMTAAVNAQEAELQEEAVPASEDNAELTAITEVTEGAFVYECDTKAKTATIISMVEAKWPKVPESVKSGSTTCKVVAIADGVGSGMETIETLSFANASNLVSIGDNCFSYCPNLHTVTFLSSKSKLEYIGNNNFYYCQKLETVENLGKQSNLTEVGSSVFGLTPFMDAQTDEFVMFSDVLVKYNGTSKNVKVPSGTVAVADAFFGSDIESIDFGTKLETVGNNAFYGCRSLKSVKLPSTCTKVGDMAFAGCTALESVEYAGKLASIGFCSFANCNELVSFKYTGSGSSVLTNIGECAFWNDRKLAYLDAGTIVNVNVGSFWNCFGDTPDETYYYRIPNTVKTIAEGGYGNLWFVYVTVPESVEALASTAFGSAGGATYVVAKGSAADEYFKNSGYNYIHYGDVNGDGQINAEDLKTIADYLAQGISDLNHNYGEGVIIDGDGDGEISTKDLNDIFRSIKEDYEAENK